MRCPRQPGLCLREDRSTRLGGGDKTLREIGGRPMLSRVLERLCPAGRSARYQRQWRPGAVSRPSACRCFADDGPAGQAGPLAGILAGLDWAARGPAADGLLLTVAGDTPFFPADLCARARPRRIGRAASRLRQVRRQAPSGLRALADRRSQPTSGAFSPKAATLQRLRPSLKAHRRGGSRFSGRRPRVAKDGPVLQREHAAGSRRGRSGC